MTDTRLARPGQAPPPPAAPRPQYAVVLVGLLLAATLSTVVAIRSGLRAAAILALGFGLGWVLFHSRFGFTSAWRQLVAVRQGNAMRAHLLLLAATCTLFAPILAAGVSIGGSGPSASVAPLGLGVTVGAFLFGLGMQMGGSCASGTLFAVGSGQSAIVLTLGGFVAGSTLGALQFGWWATLPDLGTVSLASTPAGYAGAWVLTLVVLALGAWVSLRWQRTRVVPPPASTPAATGAVRVVRGSWPMWVGALVLAVLNAAMLLVSGRAWGITFGFALWGSKLLHLIGVDVLAWGYWSDPGNLAKFRAGVLGETTSLTDLGVMVGALLASAAAGSWSLHRRIPGRLAIGAVLGGIVMGYGARIAYGCNIGAYVDGIASFSLHGYLWGAMALLGTWVGLRIRPRLGLPVPRPTDSVC